MICPSHEPWTKNSPPKRSAAHKGRDVHTGGPVLTPSSLPSTLQVQSGLLHSPEGSRWLWTCQPLHWWWHGVQGTDPERVESAEPLPHQWQKSWGDGDGIPQTPVYCSHHGEAPGNDTPHPDIMYRKVQSRCSAVRGPLLKTFWLCGHLPSCPAWSDRVAHHRSGEEEVGLGHKEVEFSPEMWRTEGPGQPHICPGPWVSVPAGLSFLPLVTL